MAVLEDSVTQRGLTSVLKQFVSMSLHRDAAAALTIAFEIRKAGYLARGETVSDDWIREEIAKTYHEMLGVTDPETGLAKAKQAAENKQRTRT